MLSPAELWMQLWSVARYDLRLTDDEFYAMTPRQLDALLKRNKQAVEHEQLLAGIIASTTANHSLNPPKTPCTPADFMPSQRGAKAEPTKRINHQRIATGVRAFLLAQKEAR